MADFALSGELTLNSREFVSAADRAAKAADQVQDRLDQLDGATATARANLDDQASDPLADLRTRLNRYDGETATAVLEIEADKAQGELRAALKQLASVNGETAEAKVLANISDAKSKLGAIDSELAKLDATVAEPRIEMPDAGGAGLDAGSMFGGGVVDGIKNAGIAGAAGLAATAAVAAFNEGTARIQMRAKFQDQFGLVQADAQKYGRMAGEIYADGWGESLQQVYAGIGQIRQQLLATGEIGESEMESLATAALATAGVFDGDVSEIIGTVGYMLRNDLAPSAEAAMDVLIDGMQNGANYAGDLFDTFTEYSGIFRDFGLDADDAMRLFESGMRNGVRDTDKLADSILELRNKTLEGNDEVMAAFEMIGLSAEDTTAKIAAGGDGAREAFVSIINGLNDLTDPTDRHNATVALMGTLYEDVGTATIPTLMAINDATKDVAGTTQELVESQDKATSQAEVFKRRLSEIVGTGFEEFARLANEYLGDLAVGLEWAANAAGWLQDRFMQIPGVEKELTGGIVDLGAAAEESAFQTGLLGESAVDAATGIGAAAAAARDSYDPTDNLAAAAGRLQGQYEAAKDALIAYADEQRAAVDPAFKAMKAQRDYEVALWKVNEAGGATAENMMKLVEADLAVDQANAQLSTSTDMTRDSMYEAGIAANLTEEQANALADQFDDTRKRGDQYAKEYKSDVKADTASANAKIAETQGKADRYRDGDYSPTVSAITGAANGALDTTWGKAVKLDRTFTATLSVSGAWAAQMAIGGVLGALNQVDGRVARTTVERVTRNITVNGARADGGPVRGGGTYLVGEEGPELVTFPHNGYVHDADTTASIMSNTTNVMNRSTITNQAPAVGRGGDFIVQNYGDRVTAEDVAIWNQRKAISA